MSAGIRGWATTLRAALVLTLLLAAFSPAPVVADNKYNRHWKQSPGGGLSRWVSYHEHLPETSYGNWMEHTMAHYYDAPNRWKPYQLSPDEAVWISADNEWSPDVWYGMFGWPSPPFGSEHIPKAEIVINDRLTPPLSDYRKHLIFCQENGHTGGLAHWEGTAKGSCLYENPFEAQNEDFTEHDTDVMYNENGHSD